AATERGAELSSTGGLRVRRSHPGAVHGREGGTGKGYGGRGGDRGAGVPGAGGKHRRGAVEGGTPTRGGVRLHGRSDNDDDGDVSDGDPRRRLDYRAEGGGGGEGRPPGAGGEAGSKGVEDDPGMEQCVALLELVLRAFRHGCERRDGAGKGGGGGGGSEAPPSRRRKSEARSRLSQGQGRRWEQRRRSNDEEDEVPPQLLRLARFFHYRWILAKRALLRPVPSLESQDAEVGVRHRVRLARACWRRGLVAAAEYEVLRRSLDAASSSGETRRRDDGEAGGEGRGGGDGDLTERVSLALTRLPAEVVRTGGRSSAAWRHARGPGGDPPVLPPMGGHGGKGGIGAKEEGGRSPDPMPRQTPPDRAGRPRAVRPPSGERSQGLRRLDRGSAGLAPRGPCRETDGAPGPRGRGTDRRPPLPPDPPVAERRPPPLAGEAACVVSVAGGRLFFARRPLPPPPSAPELSLNDQTKAVILPRFDKIVDEQSRLKMERLMKCGANSDQQQQPRIAVRDPVLMPRNHMLFQTGSRVNTSASPRSASVSSDDAVVALLRFRFN
ncbi:hypothetical protein ACHAWF_016526, partial [Thalassiosira exigua]